MAATSAVSMPTPAGCTARRPLSRARVRCRPGKEELSAAARISIEAENTGRKSGLCGKPFYSD